ncbi:MAG: hypothetical protein AYK22_05430 [Thermoplasmatales archaeon SG8-52-3]|nr:MAG: hypothetical protein AYK22_05430 [Thermoplasmatales archaeon SG8-52-3]
MCYIIIKKNRKKIIVIILILFFLGTVITPGINGNIFPLKSRFLMDKENFISPFESNAYTLFSPEYSGITYLIDMEGRVVHTWESDYIQGLAVYLLEDGKLIRNCLPGINPTFMSGGITGRVEIHDWYGNLIWEFEYFSDKNCLHHDYEVLPNGNILMIAWEYKTLEDAIISGRNPNFLPSDGIWPAHIIEVKPIGPSSGEIVWEWHAWDHLIQEYDPSKENYGIVKDHPELIDINFLDERNPDRDWLHCNSIDYNEEFDQIILSVHKFNEIWIIDHSTTTEEAAGHTDGNSGKGGDLLYRWGNPQTYKAGDESSQKLFGQHDAQWIQPGCPGQGNILVFNNGLNRPGIDYSSVVEFVPPVDYYGNYFLEPGTAYGPEESIWKYYAEDPIDFFSPRVSGVQRLPDGNTLICEGQSGHFFEVTLEKEIVWEYTNPYPNQVFNDVFKIRRYQSNYKGLDILNNAPIKPKTPEGPSEIKKGIKYYYSSSTMDPQDDEIYYLFDWGDGTDSGWLGPYNSSVEVYGFHAWKETGKYEIKLKAVDINNYESEWSDSFLVTISRNKPIFNFQFFRFLTRLSIIERLFNLLT